MVVVIVSTMLSFVILQAGTTTWHVKTTGDNSAAGTSASTSLKTLQYAVESKAQDGDTILVYPGSYIENKINVTKANLTIMALESKNRPWIDFNFTTACFVLQGAGGTVLDGINVKNGYDEWAGNITIYNTANITIKNLICQSSYRPGIRMWETHHVVISNCEITDCGRINIARDGANGWPHAILGEKNADFVMVENCKIYNNHGEGVGPYVDCNDWVIRNNEVYDNWSVNIYVDANDYDANILVENNLSYFTGQAASLDSRNRPIGIRVAKEGTHPRPINNIIIRNNIVLNCSWGIELSMYDAGIELSNSAITNNTVVNCSQHGVWVQPGSIASNTIFKNNIVSNCTVYIQDNDLIQSNNFTSGDPLFVGGPTFTGSSYRLQSGSPCRDAGTTIGIVTTDFVGTLRPQGPGLGSGSDSAYDIGAFEYVSPTAILPPQNGSHSKFNHMSRVGLGHFATHIFDMCGRMLK